MRSKQVVGPDDAQAVRVADPDHVWLTLLTCTPYGVNTHRLIVNAVSVPAPTPEPNMSMPRQKWIMAGRVLAWTLALALLARIVKVSVTEARDLKTMREARTL